MAILSSDCIQSQKNFEEKIEEVKLFMHTNHAKAIKHAKEASEIAKNKNDLGRAYWMLGYLHERNGEPAKAASHYFAAANIYETSKDHEKVAKLYENIGTIALNNRYPEMALKSYAKGFEAVNKIDNYQLKASIHLDMALAYNMYHQFGDADAELMKALSIVRRQGKIATDADLYAKIYNELGVVNKSIAEKHQMPELYDSAIRYYQLSIDFSESQLTRYRPVNNIGNVHLNKGEYDKAMDYFTQAYVLGTDLKSYNLIAPIVNNMAIVHFKKGKFSIADSLFRRSIALSLNEKQLDEVIHDKKLALAINNLDDLKLSYSYLDSLHGHIPPKENKSLLDKIHELHLTQNQIERVELKQQLHLSEVRFKQELKISKQWRQTRLLLIIFVVGLAFTIVAFIVIIRILKIRARRKLAKKQEVNEFLFDENVRLDERCKYYENILIKKHNKSEPF